MKVEKWQVEPAVKLIDEANTIAVVSRYGKEATGALNDSHLRTLSATVTYLPNQADKHNNG